ncbi:DHHA1 domain-containing protein [Clostridium sp. CX1]|uniref:DHH family phosphoesterase n=1 Tax=Clostridium sp. CX1 TaxID=2978346 RepID=UPI0021C05C1E|nr:DHHA1 domain-containing protein [Clostridium sp. CX1]MCT8975515.1 DHHA1 domain-containing protein [Clostridium sp. CX1]
MNIKLFTHNDLDGVGCAVLALLAFNKVDVEYCGYNDINDKVKDFIENKEYSNYNHVYITDISINQELAELIENTHPDNFKEGFNLCESFTLIDHHPTAMELDKYWWCNVITKNELGKTSGTSLFYNVLQQDDSVNYKGLKEFVELVRQYDTWEWKTIYNNEMSGQLSNLLGLYGKEKFVNKIIKKLETKNKFEFDETDLLLLELDKDKKQVYFEKKSKELLKQDLQNYKVGIVFADQYISELGNYLAEKFVELDFIVLIGDKTISYRGIKDIDLGVFAKQFGGGGHPKSAGSQIDKNKQLNYVKSLFS